MKDPDLWRPRRIRLIQPGLQLRLIGAFAGVASLALLAEFLVLSARLSSVAAEMPEGGAHLAARLPGVLGEVLFYAFLILLPSTAAIGVLVTFRTAGPIHRFKQYLGAVARGEEVGPCRIRTGDELHDLCDLINAALAKARTGETASAERRESA